MTTRPWTADSAMPDYDATVLSLGDADDGPLVATLVRRLADQPTSRAVLYLHGFIDYFFQAHVAETFASFGWDFYALDLRRYGRSLRAGQRPNYCTDLAEYDAEISEAARIIRAEDEHDVVVLLGHSTGGLIASLFAARHATAFDAVVLNSPFFRFAVPAPRRYLLPIAAFAGAFHPTGFDAAGLSTRYGESLLASHHGEWEYNLSYKPLRGFPLYYGWVRAIRRAHRQVANGLALTMPVLMLHAQSSMLPTKEWNDAYLTCDIVLDVRDMRAAAPTLGADVTVREIAGAMHDVFLSAEAVRDHALGATLAWVDARFPAPR